MPTRSQIEAWEVEHLETASTHWRSTAQRWESQFETIHQGMLRPGGTTWEGAAADAAVENSWTDVIKVRGAADGLYRASSLANEGAGDIAWAKQQVLDTIAEAEEAGFTVGEDLSVKDHTWSLLRSAADRQLQAQAFAAEIDTRVQTLAEIDQQAATQITSALAPLESLSFPHDHDGGATPATAVDYHRFKQEPGPADPDDPNRHAWYPERNPWGRYGPGNSGHDGDAAAQKAFNDLEEATGAKIIRQEVRATLTGPDGKTYTRYYDGLQEVPGRPDTYIGMEHKYGSSRDTLQEFKDSLVNGNNPARAMLNGRPIEIIDTDLIRTPNPLLAPLQSAGVLPPGESEPALPVVPPKPIIEPVPAAPPESAPPPGRMPEPLPEGGAPIGRPVIGGEGAGGGFVGGGGIVRMMPGLLEPGE